jgi:hypothetical protein
VAIAGGVLSVVAACLLARHEAHTGQRALRLYLVAASSCVLAGAFLVGLLGEQDCETGCGAVPRLADIAAIVSAMFLVALLAVAPLARVLLSRPRQPSSR